MISNKARQFENGIDKKSTELNKFDSLVKSKEIELGNLNDIKAKHSHCKESMAQLIENEINHEKTVLQKWQALNAKTKLKYNT